MKVLLADDHLLFIEGMQSIIKNMFPNASFECVYNGRQAFENLSVKSYDIALIDLRLPEIDGFSLLEDLSNLLCLTPIIVVTASEDPWDVEKAFGLGAMGFVSKSSNGSEIKSAIESVLRGEIVKPQRNNENNVNPKSVNWAEQHKLTPRQMEVLRLIRHGLSNQGIADRLFLSVATVKTHIVAIFNALEVKNRTEAIQQSQKLGLD